MQCLAIQPGVDTAGHLIEQAARGEQFGGAVGEHAGDQLVLAKRLTVYDPFASERGHLVDEALRGTHTARRHHDPLEAEPVLGEGHTLALGADQMRCRYADIGQRHDRMLIGNVVGVLRTAHHLHAGPGQVDHQQDMVAIVIATVETGLDEHVIGEVVRGDMPFDAVDDVVIAVAAGSGLQGRDV